MQDDAQLQGSFAQLAAFEGQIAPSVPIWRQAQQLPHQAAKWVHDFIANGLPILPPRHIFNINIPDVKEIKGAQITYQGRRAQSKPITSHVDPRGRQVYWIGLAGEAVTEPQPASSHIQSDFFAVSNGYVSITPIQMDATNYAVLDDLHALVNG